MLANRGKAIVPSEPDLFIKESTYTEAVKYIGSEPDAIFKNFPILNLRGGFMHFPDKDFFKISSDDADFFGGSGAGGSLFIYNEKYKIGFAYVMNGYGQTGGADERNIPIVKAIAEQVIKQKNAKK
jgi:CubicO group peptidase (beta-lactamase class C family)